MADNDPMVSFSERYASEQIPWDVELPPPEVIELVANVHPASALDIGCGYGRTSIYLARHNWQVDGVDFVAQAVNVAQKRAEEAGVSSKARFHVGDVTQLDFLQGPYELAIDIGCMHTLRGQKLVMYRDGVVRLLDADGLFLLFAHLRDAEDQNEEAERWIEEDTIRQLYARDFSLSKVVHGITQVGDRPPWPSAWFYLRRK